LKRVLALPAYRRLLTAYTLNELAWWVASVSLAFLIYHRTGSAIGAAAFFLCALFVPGLLSPIVVARLDQYAVRVSLPLLYGLQVLTYLALAAVASSFSLAPMLVVVLLDGILAQSARPLARAATVAVTSPAGLLREGNALTNQAFSICYMAGPALAGVVVAESSASIALLVNSGLFAGIALTLLSARSLPQAVHDPVPTAGRVRRALRHAAEHPAVRTLLTLQAVALLFFTISIPVEVVLVQHSLHLGNASYGGLLSAWGGGAVVGGILYLRWRRIATRSLIVLSTAALGVGFGLMAGAPSLVLALVGAALGGAGNGVEAVAVRTAIQELVEQRWMAMIMSLNESVFQIVPGAGIVIGGAIAALTGPRVALAVAAAGALAVAGGAWLALRDQAFVQSAGSRPQGQPTSPLPRAAGDPVPRRRHVSDSRARQ